MPELENPLVSRIIRQVLRNQQFIYHLGSTYALLGLNMVAMFFLTPRLLQHLGAEAYGVWLLLFGITNYFNLSSFGFGQTFTIELIKKKNKPKEVNKLVNTLLFSLLVFAMGTFPIFVLIQFKLLGSVIRISPELMPSASRSFWIIYLVFFLNFVAQLPFNILFACHRLSLRNGIEMGRVAINFIVTLWILNQGGGLQKLAIGTFLVTLAYIVAMFTASTKVLDFQIHYSHYSRKLFRRFLKPSFHFFLMGLAMQIIILSDSILVSALQSPSLVALYTVALRIPDVSMRLIFKIADVKAPKITSLFAAKDWIKLLLLHNRLFWLTSAAASGVAVALIFFGSWIIHFWMGADFQLNYFLLVVFSLNMLTQCILHVPGLFLQSMGMHERSSILAISGAPVSILLAWWLNKSMGLEGIAIAMCGIQLLVGSLAAPQFYLFIWEQLKSLKKPMNLFQLKET